MVGINQTISKNLNTKKEVSSNMEINSVYEGDNLEILSKFPNESINLIYLDPPFFSNKHYEVIWEDGAEIRAFQDRWQGGIAHYIGWMEPRLRECHRILKKTGSIYLHCDTHANAHLRILMDKIFGENMFLNEVIWHYGAKASQKYPAFQQKHDVIFIYSKSKDFFFNKHETMQEYSQATLAERPSRFKFKDKDGQYRMTTRRDSSGKKYRAKVYLHEGVSMDDVWDIPIINATSKERLGYPTQKPVELLRRIIKASSKEEDIVLDPFCGCGTTLVASQLEKRRWIGIDVSPTACKLMVKRLKSQFAIKAQLIKGKVDINYVKKLEPFEFQNWVVADKFYGTVSKTKSGDMGVDGLTPQITGGYPIQVKQSESVGRNVIDNFESAIRRAHKNKGYVVAFSFGKGAIEQVASLKNQGGIHIILRTVQDLLDGKIEE